MDDDIYDRMDDGVRRGTDGDPGRTLWSFNVGAIMAGPTDPVWSHRSRHEYRSMQGLRPCTILMGS